MGCLKKIGIHTYEYLRLVNQEYEPPTSFYLWLGQIYISGICLNVCESSLTSGDEFKFDFYTKWPNKLDIIIITIGSRNNVT